MTINWLPEKIHLKDFHGDWEKYFNEVYRLFCIDFEQSKPAFRGKRLGLKRHPEYDGKSATFWHMISEGSVETERVPNMRRCERIAWPKPMIENSLSPELKVWAEQRNSSSRRILIWCEEESYLVVLEDRGSYILPWTAYYVEREHQRKKYTKRWDKFGSLI